MVRRLCGISTLPAAYALGQHLHYAARLDRASVRSCLLESAQLPRLARTTGFDIESLIFSFGIGGIGAVLYDILGGRVLIAMSAAQRHAARHKLHYVAVAVPFLSFPLLYLFRWNPIYPAIIAMALGAAATMLCRPDLVRKTWVGALLFVTFYSVFLLGVELSAPGYVARVWNLDALSGVQIVGMPLEEFLFAAAFGAYWSGVYEHFTWKSLRKP